MHLVFNPVSSFPHKCKLFYVLFLFVCLFLRWGSHCVAQTGLQLKVLLPQPPECPDSHSCLPAFWHSFLSACRGSFHLDLNLAEVIPLLLSLP
jgi:hypothetical protein